MEENGISLVQMSLITTVLCVGGILATRQLVRSWGVYIPFELGRNRRGYRRVYCREGLTELTSPDRFNGPVHYAHASLRPVRLLRLQVAH